VKNAASERETRDVLCLGLRGLNCMPRPGELWQLAELREQHSAYSRSVEIKIDDVFDDALWQYTRFHVVTCDTNVNVITVLRGPKTQRVYVLCALGGKLAWVHWNQSMVKWVRLSVRPEDDR